MDAVDAVGIEKNPLREGGFACVNVGGDANVANVKHGSSQTVNTRVALTVLAGAKTERVQSQCILRPQPIRRDLSSEDGFAGQTAGATVDRAGSSDTCDTQKQRVRKNKALMGMFFGAAYANTSCVRLPQTHFRLSQ